MSENPTDASVRNATRGARCIRLIAVVLLLFAYVSETGARQTTSLPGEVVDRTGAVLPGVE